MNYAIELVFDDESQKIINNLRKTLQENGVHDEAVKLNHVSIGDYKTDNLEYSTYKNSLRPLIDRELFSQLGKNDHALNPVVLEGKAKIEVISKKAPVYEMDIYVEEDTIIQVPLLYYPGYILKGEDSNGEKVKIETFHVDGLVSFKLEKGSYSLETNFVGSKTRQIGYAYLYVSLSIAS